MHTKKKRLFSGVLIANAKGFTVFKKMVLNNEYFVANKNLNGALNRDRVLASIPNNAKEENKEAKVEKILIRDAKDFIDILAYFCNQLIIKPEDRPEDRRIFNRYIIKNPVKGIQQW